MVERRELITICRQIGTMMEVGVDFLRLTRALREQTDNPRLLELYDQIERDMRMGENLADAISKAPDVFSPFAVSLIRQGEARGDVEGAWHRLADSLKQEAQEDKDLGFEEADSTTVQEARVSVAPHGAPFVFSREDGNSSSFHLELRRFLLGAASFLAVLSALWRGAQLGLISWETMVPLQLFVAALWLFAVALWPRQGFSKKRPVSLNSKTGDLISKEPISVQTAAPGDAISETKQEAPLRPDTARTEELLRNFAPTFPVLEENSDEAEEFDDDSDSPPPHSEKRFQL
ncbi:Type II secretion system (T2SS), protein F [Abditibacterium utsteinense]|uniref:Type II secretion system (T2SS), protein F n=1 Tax=Abditibacterium utsteinense TaxID=1960156 RepID=A0A2S8SSF3_9BACT|nr:type II secretion system F family protein [Abditibacterium utsteinense]PQV63730.1 Type II secretion system (T2SS), protein F [Abditibacterium utsteinense]